MAISYVSGTTHTASSSATNWVITYSPTAGNAVVIAVAVADVSSLGTVTCKDNNGNALSVGASLSLNGASVWLVLFYGTAVTGG